VPVFGDQPDPAVPAAPEVDARDGLPDFEVAERLVPVLPSGQRTQRADTGLAGRAALLQWNVGGGVVQVDGRSGTLRPGVDARGMAGGQGVTNGLRDLVAVDGWRIGQHHGLESDGDVAAAQPIPDRLGGDGAEALDSTHGLRVRAAQGRVGEVHVQPDPRGATTTVTLPTKWRVGR
jgi:hypothetical protein